jgi:heat shock protein HspQ
MVTAIAQFRPGQVIYHKLFDYRGVVVDVDQTFQGAEDWYEEMAQSQPPKDSPWYHVLVDEAEHTTYVAERNLQADHSMKPIRHPLLGTHFDRFERGLYVPRRITN